MMSLLFNMLSRFVIFPSKEQTSFNFMTTVTVHSHFAAQENKIYHGFHFPHPPSICHEVMGRDVLPINSYFKYSWIKLSNQKAESANEFDNLKEINS